MPKLAFPGGFFWGAATSAHQVEGGNTNDWSTWEQDNASRLAANASQVYFQGGEVWGDLGQQSTDPANYISGLACDHYNRYEEDFDLAQKLHMNAHRFSIEWSRIEPVEGQFDAAAIAHYAEVVDALQKRGLEPFVTLWHWTLPIWFRDKGGWLSLDAVAYFDRYVAKIVSALPTVKFWITLNEPGVYTSNAYYLATRPPAEHSTIHFFQVSDRLRRAHITAYKTIKRLNPAAQVGIAKDSYYFMPTHSNPADALLSKLADWWRNDLFFVAIQNYQDFLGVNYYLSCRMHFSLDRERVIEYAKTEDSPAGLFRLLVSLKKYQKPIYILENGLPDATDQYRASYIKAILFNVHHAIAAGADVRGYIHWSLLDNFEWEKGFFLRFGLIAVDYQTLKRTIRPSAWDYAKIIAANGLD